MYANKGNVKVKVPGSILSVSGKKEQDIYI